MLFRQIFDEKLAQYAYLIGCQQTKEAVIIDPERDIDVYLQLAEKEGLEIVAVTDTHIHADYLTGMREFAERGVKVYASDEGDADWKYEWLLGSDYNYELLKDGDAFMIGKIEIKAVHTPGHTPEHMSFLVTDFGGGADAPMGIATGDFVFVGDLGRPDLLESAAGIAGMMEPSARTLYQSVQRFLEFEDYLQVWPAHGAGSACGKALGAVPETTVGYEKRFNGAIQSAIRSEDEFVSAILDGQPEPPMYFARMKRDNKLGPKVLGDLPNPHRLTLAELGELTNRTDVVVLDTRLDRSAFMVGHLPGSLYAPLNKSFNNFAGSYIDEEVPIYLIVEDIHLEEAIRDLVRIGLDDIVAYATPDMLAAYADPAHGGKLSRTPEVTFDEVQTLMDQGAVAFDVRGIVDFKSAHVPDAYNIAHTRLWVRRDEIPEGKKLVYCASGNRASAACALMQRLGHEVVLINDNFENWTLGHNYSEGGEIHAAV